MATLASLTIYCKVPLYVRAALYGAVLADRIGIRVNLHKLGKWAASRVKVSTRPQ